MLSLPVLPHPHSGECAWMLVRIVIFCFARLVSPLSAVIPKSHSGEHGLLNTAYLVELESRALAADVP